MQQLNDRFLQLNQLQNNQVINNTMVKVLTLLPKVVQTVKSAFNRIASKFFSLFSSKKHNLTSTTINKKKKIINKKALRSYTRRKIQRTAQKQINRDNKWKKLWQQSGLFQGKSRKDNPQKCCAIKDKFISFIKSKDQDLICSICRSLFLLPAVTECDHLFCLECVENTIVVSNKCPLCRAPIAKQESYGIRLLKTAEKILKIKERPSDQQYKNRLSEHQKWKRDRLVDWQEMNEGDRVDIWKVDCREWKRGRIQQIVKEEDTATSVVVTFIQYSEDHNEVIYLPTLRIAKFEFYSRRGENDQLFLRNLNFRETIRLEPTPQIQFNFLPAFRRTLQNTPHSFTPRLAPPMLNALVPIVPPARLPFIRGFQDLHSNNEEQTQSATNALNILNPSDNESPARNSASSEQVRPEVSDEQGEYIIHQYLPNLGPQRIGPNLFQNLLSETEGVERAELGWQEIYEINEIEERGAGEERGYLWMDEFDLF